MSDIKFHTHRTVGVEVVTLRRVGSSTVIVQDGKAAVIIVIDRSAVHMMLQKDGDSKLLLANGQVDANAIRSALFAHLLPLFDLSTSDYDMIVDEVLRAIPLNV
jgi:hypothetical protein